MSLRDALLNADYVQINGLVFETEYLRIPDDDMAADDIVIEVKHGEMELAFTRAELDEAEPIGESIFRLKSGAYLRFLTSVTLH